MRSALVRSELGYICRYAFYLLPKFLHHRTSIRLPANQPNWQARAAMSVSETLGDSCAIRLKLT